MAENHTQDLIGPTQRNIVVAMLMQAQVPFSMHPLGEDRWQVAVAEEHKPLLQRIIMVAREVQIDFGGEDEDDSTRV